MVFKQLFTFLKHAVLLELKEDSTGKVKIMKKKIEGDSKLVIFIKIGTTFRSWDRMTSLSHVLLCN